MTAAAVPNKQIAAAVEFTLLGPVRAWRDGAEVPLGSPQQRTALAVLLLREGLLTTVDELVDAIWPADPPATAVAVVRTYVSRLRRRLDGSGVRIGWIGGGYVLTAPPDALDTWRFDRHTTRATTALRRGDHAAAARELARATALHRGTPLAGIGGAYLDGQRARLVERGREARIALVGAMVELGEHAAAVATLRAMVVEEPLWERCHALPMTALHRCGRRAEALAHYRRVHRVLADELGVEPGAELQHLHRRILGVALAAPAR